MKLKYPGKRTSVLVILLLLISALVPATVSQAKTASVALTCAATSSLTASPTQISPSGSVTLSGLHFTPNQQITLNGLDVQAQFLSQADGSFNYLASGVYTQVPGIRTITATDSLGCFASTTFLIGAGQLGAALTVSPTSVLAGQQFTLSGSGFSAGASVSITTGFGLQGSIFASAAGTLSTPIQVPASTASGIYSITATDNTHSASTQIGVGVTISTTAITLSPPAATPSSQVIVNGTGFTGSQVVTVSVNASGWTPVSVTESAAGAFTATLLVPANAALTTYTVTASESFGLNQRSATATLTVSGSTSTTGVTLLNTPSAATPGQLIALTGNGYTPGALVTITGLGPSVTTVASGTGAISTNLTIPSTQATGNVVITATDTAGKFATATERIGVTGISLIANPAAGAVGSSVALSGAGFQAGETVTVGLAAPGTLPQFISGATTTFTADTAGNFSGTYTLPAQSAGSYVILALGSSSRVEATAPFALTGSAATASPTPSGTPGVVPFPTRAPTSTPVVGALTTVPNAPTTTYFAEGYTGTSSGNNGGPTFTEKLYLYNPGTATSAVTTTYYVYNTSNNTQTTVTEHDNVAPGATVVRSVNTDAGNDRFVSAVVQASTGITAETVISRVARDGSTLDSGSSLGSKTLGQTWYLAEGYTGATLQEYLTLFNPNSAAASVQVQYLPSDTPAPPAQSVSVPANGRVTINVRAVYNGLVKKGSRNIGISVTSNQPIAVDRALYWGDGSGSGKYGYSLGSAISAGKTSQYFSFLPTSSGSQSFVTVLNPSGSATTLTLSLRDASGSPIRSVSASVGAGQRHTFVLPSILTGSFGVVTGILTSGTPVVGEAGLYFGGGPNVGRHPGLVVQGTAGASYGSRANVLAAGALLRIVNTSGATQRVQVSVAGSGVPSVVFDGNVGVNAAKTVQLPAGTDPRSVVVLGSGAFAATVVNGGDGSTLAWGGNLN